MILYRRQARVWSVAGPEIAPKPSDDNENLSLVQPSGNAGPIQPAANTHRRLHEYYTRVTSGIQQTYGFSTAGSVLSDNPERALPAGELLPLVVPHLQRDLVFPSGASCRSKVWYSVARSRPFMSSSRVKRSSSRSSPTGLKPQASARTPMICSGFRFPPMAVPSRLSDLSVTASDTS